MTYQTVDQSVQQGAPFMLFEFVRGSEVWRYCDQIEALSALEQTWEPAPIAPSDLSQTSDSARDRVSFRFPSSNPFAQTYLGFPPQGITTATIYRGHLTDFTDEIWVIWKGRVTGTEISSDAVSIECEPIFTSMQRPGLRARYQRSCRHALYQRGCNLDQEAFAIPATVTAATGAGLTLSASVSQSLAGGVIRLQSGEVSFIISHQDQSLTLIRPFPELIDALAGGDVAVDLFPGCDHTASTCDAVFSNLHNYGGFPWIPGRNPFNGSII